MGQISVIVPVYKVEQYLCRCVDSILVQTFADFDLILVDDGSPDGCPAICDEYAKKDPRIHVIHQQNGGLSAARNAGIEWASANSDSEWITFIDSDDWVHEMYLEALYRAASENSSGISVCRYAETRGECPEVNASSLQAVTYDTEAFYADTPYAAIIAWAKLYRKTDFSDVVFPIGKINEDLYTTYRVLFRYPQIHVIEQPLYAYYQSPDSIMRAEWTPRFLPEADAWEEQISFFKQNSLPNARQRAIKESLRKMRSNIEKMRSCGDYYKTECRKYSKRYIRSLRKYRSDLTPKERKKAYAFIYPKMKPFFTLLQLISEKGLLYGVKAMFTHKRKKKV